MKLYLGSDNSGGIPLECKDVPYHNYFLRGYPAKLASMGAHVLLNYYYDICGKGRKTTPSKSHTMLKLRGDEE